MKSPSAESPEYFRLLMRRGTWHARRLCPCPARDIPWRADHDLQRFGQYGARRLAQRWRSSVACVRPYLQPELFRGVLTRRIFAFLIDLVVLSIPVILGYLFIAVFGLLTLGLGWVLFWLAWPASVVWAIVYYGASIGGRIRPPSVCG